MFDSVPETGTEDDAVLAPPHPPSDGQTYQGSRRGKMQSVNAIIVIEPTYLL